MSGYEIRPYEIRGEKISFVMGEDRDSEWVDNLGSHEWEINDYGISCVFIDYKCKLCGTYLRCGDVVNKIYYISFAGGLDLTCRKIIMKEIL